MFTLSATGSKFIVALGVVSVSGYLLSSGSSRLGRPRVRPTAPPASGGGQGYGLSANAISHTVYRFDDPVVASRCLGCACRRSSLNAAKVLLGETGHTVSDSVGSTGSGSFAHTMAPDGAWALVVYGTVEATGRTLPPLPVVRYGLRPASTGLPVMTVDSISADDIDALGDQFFDVLVLGVALG